MSAVTRGSLKASGVSSGGFSWIFPARSKGGVGWLFALADKQMAVAINAEDDRKTRIACCIDHG
jgi:hypothetical protein